MMNNFENDETIDGLTLEEVKSLANTYGWEVRLNIAKSKCSVLVPFTYNGFSAKEALLFEDSIKMVNYLKKFHNENKERGYA